MPLRGTCLLYDTVLKEKLFEAVEYVALSLAGSGKNATIGAVYNSIRSKGIEVDLPTVGEIYKAVVPSYDGNFSSATEIDDYTTRTYRDAIDSLVELNTLVGEKQIADEKPERAVVNFLMKALYGNLVEDQRTTSHMKQLQDALWKGMQRKLAKLGSKSAPNKKSMEDLIDESLGWEAMGITDVNGKLNSIEDLFNGMREELQEAKERIENSEADQLTIDQFNEYIKNLENASYQLLFRSADARRVRDEALKQAGFAKTVNGREILDWEKLAAYNNSVSDIRRNAEAAFLAAGYTPEVTERLKDTLQNEFEEFRADLIERQINNPKEFGQKGEKRVFNQANYSAFLAGRTEAEWIKNEQVENVEDLNSKVDAALAATKYHPLVKSDIRNRISEFFIKNYARVNAAEAQRAIDDILVDKTALEWIKENGIQNQAELDAALDGLLSGRAISPANVATIKSEFKRILDIDNKAERELTAREGRTNAPYRAKKTDVKRLVELYHLGIFNGTHDELLYRLIGVDSLKAEDLKDLEAITNVMSDLSRKIAKPKTAGGYELGDDAFASREFQYLQRLVDRIVDRNVNNKNTLLKILSFISNFFNVMLSGLLSLPRTITQNIFSGVKAIGTGMRFGRPNPTETATGERVNKRKTEFQIWKAMLSDVFKSGQAYGEEIGSFATQELFLNTLKFKWKGASIQDKAKSVLFAGTAHIRLGLLAFDSANKVALTNKVFYNIVYNSMKKTFAAGNATPMDIAQFMNDALYGQSFEDAKALARKIAENRNAMLPQKFRTKITNAYVTTLANDIVKANLATQQLIPEPILDAALKGSYHVAGLGLGHEPNNFFSRGIKNLRDNLKTNEKKLINQKDWSALAMHRTKSIALNNLVIQFAGGATNWLVLRAKEGLGLGLYHLIPGVGGNYKNDIDFSNENSLKREIQSREAARNDIARAMIGMAYTGLFYAIGFGLTGGGSGDDDKLKKLKAKKNKSKKDLDLIEELEENKSVYTSIKQNREKDQWFRTLAPDAQLIKYYADNSKEGSFVSGLIDYATRTYSGNQQFSIGGKLVQAGKYMAQGEKDAALGTLSSIVGEKISVPLWKGYKEYYRIATNPFRDEPIPPPMYKPPTNWKEGLFAGGFFEDIGLWNGSPSITLIPGIGPKAMEQFKAKGIKTISDLNDHPNWKKMKGKDGTAILDRDDIRKAEKFLEKLNKEK